MAQSLSKDPLVDLGCLIPAGIAISFFAYLAFNDPKGTSVSLQYIGGILGLVGLAAVWGRRNPYSRAARVFASQQIERVRLDMGRRLDSLHLLSPRQFEIALGRLFATEGWTVEVTPATADGGKDLILRRNSNTILVEVKQFAPGRKVGRPLIMKLHSAVVHERANGGIFVTTSEYTEPAREFAELNQLRLIDGDHLAVMLISAYPDSQEPLCLNAMCKKCGEVVPFPDSDVVSNPCPNGHQILSPWPANPRADAQPACQDCGAEMARVRLAGTRHYRFVCPLCRSGINS